MEINKKYITIPRLKDLTELMKNNIRYRKRSYQRIFINLIYINNNFIINEIRRFTESYITSTPVMMILVFFSSSFACFKAKTSTILIL